MKADCEEGSAVSAMRIGWRRQLCPEDRERVRRLVASTGFFSAEEVATATELVGEGLERGEASGYRFLFAELDGQVVGYSCFGRIPFTRSSFDLYWIAVEPAHQGRGIGRRLLAATEQEARRMGAERLYVETSTRTLYRPTRAFYERLGYRLEARLKDFYAPGDGKAIYCRALAPATSGATRPTTGALNRNVPALAQPAENGGVGRSPARRRPWERSASSS